MKKTGSGPIPFDHDMAQHGHYQYTGTKVSTKIANERLTLAALEIASWKHLRVLDVGCGDGFYTWELARRGQVTSIIGIDPSQSAIAFAKKHFRHTRVSFQVADGEKLPFRDNSFDIVHLRGVLHHMPNPEIAVAEALRVAPQIVIMEPNGYNIVLKIIERVSPYHQVHQERSFAPHRINQWIRKHNGKVTRQNWVGLVPFFCPNWVAHTLKLLEEIIENIPFLGSAATAVYVVKALRR